MSVVMNSTASQHRVLHRKFRNTRPTCSWNTCWNTRCIPHGFRVLYPFSRKTRCIPPSFPGRRAYSVWFPQKTPCIPSKGLEHPAHLRLEYVPEYMVLTRSVMNIRYNRTENCYEIAVRLPLLIPTPTPRPHPITRNLLDGKHASARRSIFLARFRPSCKIQTGHRGMSLAFPFLE